MCLEASEWEPLLPLCFSGAMQTYEKPLPRKGIDGGLPGGEVSFMQSDWTGEREIWSLHRHWYH